MGNDTPRITTQTLAVLAAFSSLSHELSGSEIAKITKLQSGTLYPILFRLEGAAWLESQWETTNASELGRPRRRIYRLSATGAKAAANELKKMAETLGGLAWHNT